MLLLARSRITIRVLGFRSTRTLLRSLLSGWMVSAPTSAMPCVIEGGRDAGGWSAVNQIADYVIITVGIAVLIIRQFI